MRTLRHGLPKFHLDIQAAQFSKADLRAARDAIADRGVPIAGEPVARYLGPVLKWAAQEDLIPHNFVPEFARAPSASATGS